MARMNHVQFSIDVLQSKEKAIAWARGKGLLATRMDCPECNVPLREQRLASSTDGYVWRCLQEDCRQRFSIRRGSFFTGNVDLIKLLDLVWHWSARHSHEEIMLETGLSTSTVTNWINYLREICSADLIANRQMIGGVGHVVAIDESMVARRKSSANAQARPTSQIWVFGGVDIDTKECFLQIVPRRNATTLLPIIQANIMPGTTVWSDEWQAYNNLTAIGYDHETVNHSIQFVSPSGVHTNDIESLWCAAKRYLKKVNGAPEEFIPGYLDEFMWRRQKDKRRIFEEVVAAIARNPSYRM